MADFTYTSYGPPLKEIRLVLIGKTGNGKSRTGNSILGQKNPDTKIPTFLFSTDSQSVTYTCKWESTTRFGKKIDVVDTPGVFDTSRNNFDVQQEIKRCIGMTTPGIHAVLLCIKGDRFTQEDIDSLNHFVKYFGEELFRFTVVVFTQVDKWEKDQEAKGSHDFSSESYIKNLPEKMRIFLEKCSNRYVFFNNRLKGEEQEKQVKRLIHVIDGMIIANNNKCYTNDMYEKVEVLLTEEIKKTGKDRDEVKNSKSFLQKVSDLICTVAQKVIDCLQKDGSK